jgi:hypothetical protein
LCARRTSLCVNCSSLRLRRLNRRACKHGYFPQQRESLPSHPSTLIAHHHTKLFTTVLLPHRILSCSVALKTAVGSSASDEHTTLTAGCVLSIRSSARSSARSSTLQVCTSSTRDMHMSNTIAEANATVTSFRGGSMLSRAVSSKQKTLALHSFTLSMSLPKHRHGSSRPTRRRRQRHGPRRHPRATARWR